MGLKSAHFEESDFQESGVGDRFLKMGAHFQERSGSLEYGLCVTWSGFWVCPGCLWRLILVAVEQIDDQITRRLVAQRVAPAAPVILSQTPSFRRWRLLMETMAYWQQVSLSLPRCSYLFVLQRPRTSVPTGPTYRQRHLLRTAYFARGWRLIDRPKPSTCSYLPCSYLTIRLPPRCSGCLFLFQYSMSTCPIMLCSTVCCAVQQ